MESRLQEPRLDPVVTFCRAPQYSRRRFEMTAAETQMIAGDQDGKRVSERSNLKRRTRGWTPVSQHGPSCPSTLKVEGELV